MSSQSVEITFTGISRALKAMPATPRLLLVSWPIVPLTWVPCPSRSKGSESFQMKSWGHETTISSGPGQGQVVGPREGDVDESEGRIVDAVEAEGQSPKPDGHVAKRHAGVEDGQTMMAELAPG